MPLRGTERIDAQAVRHHYLNPPAKQKVGTRSQSHGIAASTLATGPLASHDWMHDSIPWKQPITWHQCLNSGPEGGGVFLGVATPIATPEMEGPASWKSRKMPVTRHTAAFISSQATFKPGISWLPSASPCPRAIVWPLFRARTWFPNLFATFAQNLRKRKESKKNGSSLRDDRGS